ncbi:MAG TPA: RidA family protein [Chloroflexota bacterium]|nr:RidA family protein [Chloroflexota bacterium]
MSKRQVLEGHGLPRHRNPIPAAVKIGGMVFSSAISGEDAERGWLSPEPGEQVAQAFRNLRRAIELAGGTTDDIAKVTVYLRDMQHRELVNREWVAMFPDPHDRPARHTVRAELPEGMVVQLEFIAVL